jgi:4-amino-4-deoxy-L-arabinose transferase-like glycosyltransferase
MKGYFSVGKKLSLYSYLFANSYFVVALVIGFFLRLYAFEHCYVINSDSVYYIYQARAIANNMWNAAQSCGPYHFVSIYPFLIVLFHNFIGDWMVAAQVTSLFFGIITIVPLYFLLRRFFSHTIAGIVALIFACNPFFVRESTEIMKDPVFWFFSVLGIYLFIKAADKGKGEIFFLSSFSFCLASLARIEGLVLYSGSLLYLFFRKERDYKHIISFGLPIIAIILVAFSSFFISKGGRSLWDIYFSPRLQTISSQVLLANPFSNPFTKKLEELNDLRMEFVPPGFFKWVQKTLWILAFGVLLMRAVPAFYFPFFLLFLAGIKGIKKEMGKEALIFYLFLLSVLSFVFLYIFVLKVWVMEKRYTAVFLFPSFIFVGFGLLKLIDFLERKGLGKKATVLILSILIIASTLPENLKDHRKDKLPFREIGEYIAAEGQVEKAAIASSSALISFYTHRHVDNLICPAPVVDYEELIKKQYPDLITFLKANRIDYFVWEEDRWKGSSYDFLESVNVREMSKLGKWGVNRNGLVLFRVNYQ